VPAPPTRNEKRETRNVVTLFFVEVQRRGIHAITLAGRAGAIVKDMSEVRSAFVAHHLHAPHSVARIGLGSDAFRSDWRRETGPPRAGIGLEQGIPAAYAAIGAILMMVPIFSGEGWFGAFAASHLILLGRQLAAPVRIGFHNFWFHNFFRPISSPNGALVVAPDFLVFCNKRRIVGGGMRNDQPIEGVSYPFLVERLFDDRRKRQVAYR
jgi:hypothetical protein